MPRGCAPLVILGWTVTIWLLTVTAQQLVYPPEQVTLVAVGFMVAGVLVVLGVHRLARWHEEVERRLQRLEEIRQRQLEHQNGGRLTPDNPRAGANEHGRDHPD